MQGKYVGRKNLSRNKRSSDFVTLRVDGMGLAGKRKVFEIEVC